MPYEAATDRSLKGLLPTGAGGRHGVRPLCSPRQQNGAAARAHGGAVGPRQPGGIQAKLTLLMGEMDMRNRLDNKGIGLSTSNRDVDDITARA